MKVIAESSSDRAEWVLCDGPRIIEHVYTSGLNPYFKTRRELSHTIRLELPTVFFKRRWDHIYFYGAGCVTPERQKMVETSIIAQFRSPCTVESDIVGAARGLLQRKSGLVCILGSGSNSGYYDGSNIVKNVRGLGFILGNEGSNSHIGRMFVSDLLKGLTPHHLAQAFYEKFKVSDNDIMDDVYEGHEPSKALSVYAEFLKQYEGEAYVHDLIYESIMSFFKRNIALYHYKENPIHFVGSTCLMYRDILCEVAKDFGVEVGRIEPYSMEGLMQYHSR